jgi:hypothetical protein
VAMRSCKASPLPQLSENLMSLALLLNTESPDHQSPHPPSEWLPEPMLLWNRSLLGLEWP